jgi:hypothetical protein
MKEVTVDYLNDAAADLARAREANSRRAGLADELRSSGREQQAHAIDAEVADRALRIAEASVGLAAIKAGLPPCYHPARPEPGQEES